jgi:hypothetical protein
VACWTLVILWAVSLFAVSDPRDEFATETGLDRDLVNLVQIDVGGIELTVTFVYINERTFQSKISAELSWTLQSYIGQNAIYVNPSIDAVVDSFGFNPELISIEQSGVVHMPSVDSWIEITPGFLAGQFEVNPSGPAQGSGSEGVLFLGESIDALLPFEVTYAGQRAAFEIGAILPTVTQTTGSPTAATQSHDPIEVAPLETLGTLEELLLHEDFSDEAMAALFELDPSLVRTMVLSLRGSELRLFFVRLEGSVRTSLLGPELITAVDEVIGTGAVMVWAVSPTGASFTPWNFYIRQNNTNYVFFSTASFVELTESFLRVEQVEAGGMAAGVIRLPRSVDSAVAFSVFYGTSGVDYP